MKDAPDKPKRHRPQPAETRRNDRYVVRDTVGWAVKKPGAARASGVYRTQAEAENAAREIVRRNGGGEVRIHGRDGRWRDSFTLGRSSFAQITAVEGIRLSRGMKRDFREFDRKQLSANARRQAIVSKYGKKPA